MAAHDIIVIGASAGGVGALRSLVRGLPPGLPAALFVVCHFPAGQRSVLPDILSRAGPLLAHHARDGEPIYPGHIYVAPPDRHLLVEADRVRLHRGPRENRHRPAIDPLFRSAARAFGPRTIGVILSGALHDGAAGLLAVRTAGGVAVVQDPEDAEMASMPLSAAEIAGADHVAAAEDLAPLLAGLVTNTSGHPGGPTVQYPLEPLPDVMADTMRAQERGERQGDVSVYVCPECGGPMWQLGAGGLLQFRCHVGHAYNGEVLLEEQQRALEAALWIAVRTFREKSILARQMARRARAEGNDTVAERYDDEAHVGEHYGEVIRQYLLQPGELLHAKAATDSGTLAPDRSSGAGAAG